MSMAVDDETAIETGERTIGIYGTDVQRMTFDPDKSRNFTLLQIPTLRTIENSFNSRRYISDVVSRFVKLSQLHSEKLNYYMYPSYVSLINTYIKKIEKFKYIIL